MVVVEGSNTEELLSDRRITITSQNDDWAKSSPSKAEITGTSQQAEEDEGDDEFGDFASEQEKNSEGRSH